jgi:hypothetical protein
VHLEGATVSENGEADHQAQVQTGPLMGPESDDVCVASNNTSDHLMFSTKGLDVSLLRGEKRSRVHDDTVNNGNTDIHISKRKRLDSE